MNSKNLIDEALNLPRKKRAFLADKLLKSLEEDQVLDQIIEECDKRWEAYRKGEIKGIPAEDIFPELGRKKRTS